MTLDVRTALRPIAPGDRKSGVCRAPIVSGGRLVRDSLVEWGNARPAPPGRCRTELRGPWRSRRAGAVMPASKQRRTGQQDVSMRLLNVSCALGAAEQNI